MNTPRLIAETLLGFSLISTAFPAQMKDMKDTLNNTPDFFMKPITIKKEDSLSPINFKDIFGKFDNEGNLEEFVPRKIERNTMRFGILPAANNQIIVMKIGSKSIVINPGSDKYRLSLLRTLGAFQVSKLDTIIYSDITSSPENIYSLLDMGMVSKVIVPVVDLEPNSDNVALLKKFSDVKNEIKKRGGNIIEMRDKTKIQLDDCIITSVLPKNTPEASLLFDDEDTIVFVQGYIPREDQNSIVLPNIKTYISKTNVLISKDLLKNISPTNILLSQYTNNNIDETINNVISKVGRDKVFILNDQNGVNISSPNAKPDESTLTINAQSNNT